MPTNPCALCNAATFTPAVTPPGFFTAAGNTSRCELGSFRDGWSVPEAAGSCGTCGRGVFGSLNEMLDVYDPVTETLSLLPIATDASGCCEWHWQ